MLLRKNLSNRTLFAAGTMLVAMCITLKAAISHTTGAGDGSDFSLGLLLGTGLGLLLVGLMRQRAQRG